MHVRQLCDPTDGPDGTGRMTGVVRDAVEEMWGDLKRGHFIDQQTRAVTITLQLKSNAMGVRYRATLTLQFTSLGAILPSYDIESRNDAALRQDTYRNNNGHARTLDQRRT